MCKDIDKHGIDKRRQLMNYLELKEKYHSFIYETYEYQVEDERLSLRFSYSLEGEGNRVSFTHKVTYETAGNVHMDTTGIDELENFIFHIGMIETINYWNSPVRRT